MRRLAIAALLAAVVLGVFWPVVHNDFVNYDDDRYVTLNPRVQQGFDAPSLRWAWTTTEFYWHPITWMSHILDWRLYGAAPAGHHATNLALHAANTALLFLLLEGTTGAVWRSALVAALFALHPLRVESVAWVAERKDVLSACFWLLTTLAWVRWTRRPGVGRYALVVAGLALGLMTKPMLVTLPFTLLLLDVWPLGRLRTASDLWPRVREKLPLLPLVVASCVVTIALERQGAIRSLETYPLLVRLENALVSYVAYLGKLVWPTDLVVLYLHPRGGIPAWQIVGAAAFLGAVTAAAVRWRATRPWVLVGWLWYLGTLVPVSGIVQAGEQAMADRFTYVPMIGVVIALVWSIPPRAPAVFATAAAVALGTLAVLTRAQIAHWRSSVTLFEHALAVAEDNATMHLNLGFALGDRGEVDQAIVHFQRVLALNPRSPRALVGLGNALVARDRVDEAVPLYAEALAMDENSEHALTNYAYALGRLGRHDEAIALYERALAIDPLFAVAHKNLGVELANRGRAAEALAHFEQAVRSNANDPEALNDLGVALMTAGRLDEGLPYVERAVTLGPRNAQWQTNRILGLFQLGRFADAWAAVNAARAAGAALPPELVAALAAKMPEPR